jgi:ferredoxin
MVGEVAANLKSLDPGSKWGFASNTDYTHSVPAPMDPETREKLISRFQPRVSKHDCISHDACIEAQVDVFDKDNIGKVIGGMNAYNSDFTALCAAEALPERIGLCSYFIEYAFVHDG